MRIFKRGELRERALAYVVDILERPDTGMGNVVDYNRALILKYGAEGLCRIKELAWKIKEGKVL